MDWKNVIYVLIIALLYIPMVFLGATTVFPDEGDYFIDPIPCYESPYPGTDASPQQIDQYNSRQQDCREQNTVAREDWESNRESLEAKRYVFVTVANLIVLSIAVFVPLLTSVVALGLFIGSTVSAFIATLTYFESANTIGFGLLVVLFFIVVFFISRTSKGIGKEKGKKSKR